MSKNLTIKAGNCPHRRYESMQQVIDAYKAFDKRKPGWLKVEVKPRMAAE